LASVELREKRPPEKAVKRFDERMVYPVVLQTEATQNTLLTGGDLMVLGPFKEA